MAVTAIMGQKGTGKSTLLKHLTDRTSRLLLIDTLSEHRGGMVVTYEEWLAVIPSYGHERFRFVIRELEPDDFEDFCRWVRALGDCTLAIDEIDFWTRPNWTPPEFAKLIRYGRHHGVSLVVVGRRPADVPRLLTSQIDLLYTYRQVEPCDLKWVTDVTGQRDLDERVAQLPDFTVVEWDARDRENVKLARILLTDGAAELEYIASGTPEQDPPGEQAS